MRGRLIARHGSRVTALVALPRSGRVPAHSWTRAIARAAALPRLDLVVTSPPRRARRALDGYLELLERAGSAPGGTADPGAGPDGQVPPVDVTRPTDPGRPADLFVASAGSDAGNCTASDPCRSFDRAFRVAAPGQVVEVAGGGYPDQVIRDVPGRTAPRVVFRPARGAEVTVDSDLDVEASHVEFADLRLTENWYAHEGARDLVFRDIRAARFQIASATDVRVAGGSYGPSLDAVSQIKAADGGGPPAGIEVVGVTMHDYRRSSPAQHMECLHVMSAVGVAIRRSRFDDCSIFGISFNAHDEHMRGVIVENSWFGDILDGGAYAVHFSSGVPCEAVVRFNSFAAKGISQDCPAGAAGIRVNSNILPGSPSSTASGYVWDHNLYASGEPVGPHDLVAAPGFLDSANFDLHVRSGFAGIDRGDPSGAPAVDVDGEPRDGAPDIGADEHR